MIQSHAATTVRELGALRASPTAGKRLGRFCRRKPLGVVGAAIVAVLLLVGAAAPRLAPYGYAQTDVAARLQDPSHSHLLGTDNLGRDVLSRLLYGARSTIYISFGATALAALAAIVLGVSSAYYGGWFDTLLQRFVDIWLSFPLLILALVTISIFGGGILQLIFALGLLTAAGSSRVVRSKALSVAAQPFVEAARTVGAPDWRIVVAHVVPNVLPTVLVLSAVRLGAIVITEAALSFLGFGVPPPYPTWGVMLQDSLEHTAAHPWLAVWPGLAISLVVFGYNMLGDALRDELDPRLRRT